MTPRVPPVRSQPPHEGAPRLSGAQLVAINRFPDDNPNPVMRVDDDGVLIYANPASLPACRAMGVGVGGRLPDDLLDRIAAVVPARGFVELAWDGRTFAVWPVPIVDLGFTNLYGMDVTAERAIVKFPDQNPNPVLRMDWDGRLVYANPASRLIVDGLELAVGAPLPATLRGDLMARLAESDAQPVEVEASGHVFALTPVDVPGFGFINLYGTDVTAARENERLARENERLLLNILPGPIAQRLRDGERMIADRFDDVTLLFADIVEFTRLSSTLSATELVTVLNDVFTVFDALVDRYGLEKVKTIGDAYMVVGGMTDPTQDHTSRVVAMGLALTEAVERIEPARRLAISFRVGVHCGPVVAGVIGTRKFIYDIWGDTVNLASRMESMGIPGRVQVTHAVIERLGDSVPYESRGLLDVKGKGPTPAYLLGSARASARATRRPAWVPADGIASDPG